MGKKHGFFIVIIILFVVIFSITVISSKDRVWKGKTYFFDEYTKIVFEENLEQGDNLTIRLDSKILKDTDVFLELHTPEDIIRWDKKFKETRENLNYEVKKNGKYSLLIIFTNKNSENAEAEVEVNWKF
ncbi:MAG: hypothetical protein ACQESN_05510 [Thermotogota bacterium]